MRDRILLLALLTAAATQAQAPSVATTPASSAPLPSFEVATVRPTPPNAPSGYWSWPGRGRFDAVNLPFSKLMELAYGVDASQIANKPAWLDSACFDISAKPEDGIRLTSEELRPRLQRLLEERFHLAAHHETSLVSGYALVVAKHGPMLQPTKADHFPNFRANVSAGHLEGFNWSMPFCALMLTPKAGLPVVDQTGLAGSYDIRLRYATEDAATDSQLPSLFTALRETLGLELKAQKVPVDRVVIDHVDRVPTDN
jgi:uncharacterized protein (TIGR03435 family)